MSRNLLINAYFRDMAERHRPQFRFTGSTKEDWENWKYAFYPRLKETLGQMPRKVPLNPEIIVEWQEDGLVKQKIIFDVEEGLSATAYLFHPAGLTEKVPGILACHGHGLFGKEYVMGNNSTSDLRAGIEVHNYDYGLRMAKAGYAVLAIDWRGFGERDDRQKPNWNDNIEDRDICNVHYLRASIMGMTILGMNIHDGMCAIDYLSSRDFVDTENIGVMGLSLGGTMSTWMSLCDYRIKATNIICYSDCFADFGMRDINICGSQITPGLFTICDVPDLHGLIAPRPLLVEIGIYDDCFKIESAMKCFREVKKIFTASEANDKLELDLFEGGHEWGANQSLNFFDKYIKSVS